MRFLSLRILYFVKKFSDVRRWTRSRVVCDDMIWFSMSVTIYTIVKLEVFIALIFNLKCKYVNRKSISVHCISYLL